MTDMPEYLKWGEKYSSLTEDGLARVDEDRWQQFVIRLIDERGDPVPDYYVELADEDAILEDFASDVHAFTADPSLRSFHVNLSKLAPERRASLHLRLGARSGTELIAYHGAGSEVFTRAGTPADDAPASGWDARFDLTPLLRDSEVKFFFPYTTTLVEITINREPLPAAGVSDLLRFVRD